MKKLSCTLVLSLIISTGFAQIFKIESIKKLPTPDQQLFYPRFSPDGKQLLCSSENYQGIRLYDIKTGKLSTLNNENGAGFEAQFTPDGQQIVYNKADYSSGRRQVGIYQQNILNKTIQTIEPTQRNLRSIRVEGDKVYYLKNEQPADKNLQAVKKGRNGQAVVSMGENGMIVRINGTNTVVAPLGEGSYLWPSLSPDKKMLVFKFPTKGVYTCDLDGKNLTLIGQFNAPAWYDNHIIIGMNDKDNGHFITSSSIIACSKDGKTMQTLTDKALIAMYPTSFVATQSIGFNTPKGELYLIQLSK